MKNLSVFYTGLLACLTTLALSAAATPPSTSTLSTAINPEDGPKINETYILKNATKPNASNLMYATEYHLDSKDPAYISYISNAPDPTWVYPDGKNLALKFFNFNMVTPTEQLRAFAALAVVLQAARGHPDYGRVVGTQSYRWGDGVPVVVVIGPEPGSLLWGDIIDTVIAVQIFLSTNPYTTFVAIYSDDAQKRYLGLFTLSASTSTVSSS